MLTKTNNYKVAQQDVVAIIVAYCPDYRVLDEALCALRAQVRATIIVDNGGDARLFHERYSGYGVRILSMGGNKGVGAAHNAGIKVAKSEFGARYVLLMDQDSIADSDMVRNLISALEKLPDAACVGPRYLDTRRDNPPPFIKIKGLRLLRHQCESDDDVVSVDYLVTSGSLIPTVVLDKVGGMRTDFFIDYVDIEWGLRAKRYGYQSYGVCAAKMKHHLGDSPLRFLGMMVPIHNPLRHYYHFRNAVILYREPWVPIRWKLVDAYRLILKYGFYSIFGKPRWAHFKMMTVGVWHGVIGKLGEYKDQQDIKQGNS